MMNQEESKDIFSKIVVEQNKNDKKTFDNKSCSFPNF